MRVLVTGVAGFIGSHFAEALVKRGRNVVGLDNFNDFYPVECKQANAKYLERLGVEILTLDLRENDLERYLPKDITHIFHFAAQPGLSANSTFQDYLSNNVMATKQLLDYAKTLSTAPYFINISTSSVYGSYATQSEDKIPEPSSMYGVTKLMAEQMVLSEYRNLLLPACSFRLYSVYGPRERPDKMFSKLLNAGLQHKPFYLFEGSASHRRSFTYISDIVDGLLLFLKNQDVCNGEIINLGSDIEYTTVEGILAVEALLGQSIELISKSSRIGDQMHTRALIDKAKRILGYNPKISLEQGLKQQLDWIRS